MICSKGKKEQFSFQFLIWKKEHFLLQIPKEHGILVPETDTTLDVCNFCWKLTRKKISSHFDKCPLFLEKCFSMSIVKTVDFVWRSSTTKQQPLCDPRCPMITIGLHSFGSDQYTVPYLDKIIRSKKLVGVFCRFVHNSP